jgi:hypothetical protein
MQTTNPSSAYAAAMVKFELKEMLDRCEAAGLAREAARDTLANIVMMESLRRWGENESARAAAAAQSPAGQALQKAFELRRANNDPAFQTACHDYLREAHGVSIGDTVEIYGWVTPRVLRLTNFRLCFDSAECPTQAFMWFQGDAVRNCRPGRTGPDHGCPLDKQVRKVSA